MAVKDQTGCSGDPFITLTAVTPFLLDIREDQQIALGCEYDITPLFNRELNEIGTYYLFG